MKRYCGSSSSPKNKRLRAKQSTLPPSGSWIRNGKDNGIKDCRRFCFVMFDPLTFVVFRSSASKPRIFRLQFHSRSGTRETTEISTQGGTRRSKTTNGHQEPQGTEDLRSEVSVPTEEGHKEKYSRRELRTDKGYLTPNPEVVQKKIPCVKLGVVVGLRRPRSTVLPMVLDFCPIETPFPKGSFVTEEISLSPVRPLVYPFFVSLFIGMQ